MATRLREVMQAWRPTRPRLLPAERHRRVLAQAWMERHGGLTVLYLSGTPYEMGYQHGVLARDLIHGFRKAAYAYVATRIPGPGWLARSLLLHRAAAYWPTVPQEIAEEIRGIADGAGVHPVEVLAANGMWELPLASGCSGFAAVRPTTAYDSLLHGYNYDLMAPAHALIQPYLAVLFYQPDQGVPFFTANTVGSVGANAGMNQAGVSVAWDNTYLRDERLIRPFRGPAIPFPITLRRLLQHARSLEEAVRVVVRTLPRPLADIVIISSASEDRAVALETAGDRYAVREMEEGAIWSTNCFRSPELAPLDRRGDGRGLSEEEAWQQFPRYTAYRQLFAAHRGQVTPAVAVRFLRDPYPREAEGFVHPNPAPRATICRDITSWSLVMEPGRGRFWVSDVELPGSQGCFFAFSLPRRRRLPERDCPPTGYRSALRCAERFLEGHREESRASLEAAIVQDGLTAPLLLMRALLDGLGGQEERAAESLRRLVDRWGGTPMGRLAQSWLGETDAPISVPFPSAIKPLIRLRPGPAWPDRAVPWATS